MAPTNIELFNEMVGLVFAQLYQAFPYPISIDGTAIADSLKVGWAKAPVDANSSWPPSVVAYEDAITGVPFGRLLSETLRWLQEEGFVQNRSVRTPGVYVLSARALTVLSAIPTSLAGTAPLGTRLKDAAKDAGTETGRAVIGELVGLAIGAAARGFTGS